jgi:two-component system OmpR family response regulator
VTAPCPHIILVIEDERDTRETLCEILEDAGFSAVGVAEGQAGLDHLAARAAETCLIVLDLMIPFGLDGWTFRAAQRGRPEWSSIPVVIVSAVADLEARTTTLAPTACLRKPLAVADLLRLVERHCGPPPVG